MSTQRPANPIEPLGLAASGKLEGSFGTRMFVAVDSIQWLFVR
jgi:hypothetical protein